jgi:Ca2+/Na+ antiporter
MLTTLNYIAQFILVISIVAATAIIYRKTHSKAEFIIMLAFLFLSIIKGGVLFGWDIMFTNSKAFSLVNISMLTFGYWWLVFTVIKVKRQINHKDRSELKKFRKKDAS